MNTVEPDCTQLMAENQRLREQLFVLRQRAIETEDLFQRHQQWEMELLALAKLEQLLHAFTLGMRERFTLDAAVFILWDRDHSIRGLLTRLGSDSTAFPAVQFLDEEHQLPQQLTELMTPYVGPLTSAMTTAVFTDHDRLNSAALLPLWREQNLLGVIGLGSQDSTRYAADLETHFLQRLAAVCAVCLENVITQTRLEMGGLTDPLTGLNNRRALKQRLYDELVRAQRLHQPLSCLFIDLDYFKQINDEHGHAAGDTVLMQLAQRLLSTLRTCDFAVRFGGDELTVLLPASAPQDACVLAERIRHVVVTQPFIITEQAQLTLTVSIGTATMTPEAYPTTHITPASGDDLLRCADEALYEAKRAGRNCVACRTLR